MTTADHDSAEATDQVDLRIAVPEDAGAVLALVHEAFGARPPVDPPAAALSDTIEDVLAHMETGEVVLAEVAGLPAASLVVSDPVPDGSGRYIAGLHRVSVSPGYRHLGVASIIIRAGVQVATQMGATHLELLSRREFPETLAMWQSRGFVIDREVELGHMMRHELPVQVEVPDAEAMKSVGACLATILRAGDLVVASGGLGAGKTTLSQGLAAALDVDGAVLSPTFVLSRVHPSRRGGPDLVHVDAYRLRSALEVHDLDLDATLPTSVTLVEWGAGLVETLSDSVLRLDIARSEDPEDETRVVQVWGEGPRWAEVSLHESLATCPGGVR